MGVNSPRISGKGPRLGWKGPEERDLDPMERRAIHGFMDPEGSSYTSEVRIRQCKESTGFKHKPLT